MSGPKLNYNQLISNALYAKNQQGIKKFINLAIRRIIKRIFFLIKNPKAFLEYFYLVFHKKNRLIEELKKNGFMYFRLDITKPLIKSLEPKLSKLIKKNGVKVSQAPLKESEIFQNKWILKILKNKQLYELIKVYFRAKPYLVDIAVWNSVYGRSLNGSPMLHLDSGGEKIIRMYIYLNDVSKDNGAFSFLPKKLSNKFSSYTGYLGDSINDKDFVNKGKNIDISLKDIITVSGKAGTSFLIDTAQNFHYGSRMRKGVRLVAIISWDFPPESNNKSVMRKRLLEYLAKKGEDKNSYYSL